MKIIKSAIFEKSNERCDEIKGLIKIEYLNLNNDYPFNSHGNYIILDDIDLTIIKALYKALNDDKYEYIFLLSLCIFIISRIMYKQPFNLLRAIKEVR